MKETVKVEKKQKPFKLEKKPIKYIENKPDIGKVIDWKYIQRKLMELVSPYVGDAYVPYPPMDQANWFVINSERSVGKTTNILLMGMILFESYGITTEYLRIKKDQVRPINFAQLFATIENPTFDYVGKVTGGKYHGIYYNRKAFYFANFDCGKVIKEEICPDPFCHIECTDNVDNIKSLYNNPNASFVIVDEFINASGINKENDFLNLCQILSTYRRNRLDMKIFMLANTINPYNQFYKELCISDEIRSLKLGDEKIVETPLGTHVWIKLVKFDEKVTEKRRVNNLFYFGFLNPKLASINGGAEWAIKNYPHLPRLDEEETRICLMSDVYLRYYNKMLCLEIWNSDKIGRFLYVREQTREPLHPLRFYTQEPCMHYLDRYGLGTGDNLDKLIRSLYDTRRVFYSYNDIGNLFENYILNLK